MGRIKCGGEDDGEPAVSPPDRKPYSSRVRSDLAAHDVGGTCFRRTATRSDVPLVKA
jgi:hypothetical protein